MRGSPNSRLAGPQRSRAQWDALAIQRVREILRNRERPAVSDVAYVAYLVIMLTIIVAAPIVRGLALWLAQVLPAEGDPLLVQLGLALGAAFVVMLPIIGWYAAPARMSLPELDLLFTSDLPRWRMFAGRVIRLATLALLAGVAGAGLFLVARALRGEFVAGMLAPVLSGGAVAGLLSGLLLLLGQLSRGTRWQLLREQAERIDAVSTLVATGEFRSAAGRIGAPVTLGRNWAWFPGHSDALSRRSHSGSAVGVHRGISWLFVSRDLLGIARTPVRSIAALLGMSAAGVIAGITPVGIAAGTGVFVSAETSVGVAALGGMFALIVAYAAIGPWCRGLRTAGESIGALPLLPLSSSGLLLRHLAVPAMLSAAVCAGIAMITASIVPPIVSTAIPVITSVSSHQIPPETAATQVLTAAIFGLFVGMFALALRLLGALKGPLPQSLLAPVPTPAGDLSGINVMLWNLDGLIVAALIGATLAALATAAPVAGLITTPTVLVLLLAWSGQRLRRLERSQS